MGLPNEAESRVISMLSGMLARRDFLQSKIFNYSIYGIIDVASSDLLSTTDSYEIAVNNALKYRRPCYIVRLQSDHFITKVN